MPTKASSELPFLESHFARLARDSQVLWHPLGFVSCVIRDEPNRLVARLHYWPANERRPKKPDWPIHTHIYDLSSFILAGRVRDIQYEAKRGDDYSLFSVSYVQDGSSVSAISDRASIDVCVDEFHQAGEEYFVPVGKFHQTFVAETESAITLVVQSNFQDASPLVVGDAREVAEPYTREPFDRQRFWSQIEVALRLHGFHVK